MERYGRGVELRGTLSSHRETCYAWNDGKPYIQWAVTHGLASLLHELGHHRLRHDRLGEFKGIVRVDELAEEAEAWLWAEERARRHEVKIDYKLADKWFETYCKGRRKEGVVLINWRYKK